MLKLKTYVSYFLFRVRLRVAIFVYSMVLKNSITTKQPESKQSLYKTLLQITIEIENGAKQAFKRGLFSEAHGNES